MLQKIYGKQPDNILAINKMFHSLLGDYPSSSVIRAFEIWLERSQEFPTPADIIGIIKRKGKQPITREVYISTTKKDPEYRTSEDWALIRAYEDEQKRDSSAFHDEVADNSREVEMVRLRQDNIAKANEIKRLNQIITELKAVKGIAAAPTAIEKVQNTIKTMRQGGAPESDIELFVETCGINRSLLAL